MKRRYLIGVIIISLVASLFPIQAATVPKDMQTAYNYTKKHNPDWLGPKTISHFSVDVWNQHHVLAIAKPLNSIKDSEGRINKKADGQWRFVGVAPSGEAINNPDYPYDYYGKMNIHHYDYNPRRGGRECAIDVLYSDLAKRQAVMDDIFSQLKDKFGHRFDVATANQEVDQWIGRATLLMLPTPTSRGVVRFSHNTGPAGSKGPFYFTVVLSEDGEPEPEDPEPEEPNPEVSDETVSSGDANLSLVIGSHTLEHQLFDVEDGIPTSE